MYMNPIKKVNKSSDKRQKQRDKHKSPQIFLKEFIHTLEKYRRRKIAKMKQTTEPKKYKSESLHKKIYKEENKKNESYSKVYHTLNDKKEVRKSNSQSRTIVRLNRYHSTGYRYTGRNTNVSRRNNYRRRNPYAYTKSAKSTTKRSLSPTQRTNITNKETQVRKTARPISSISTKKLQTTITKTRKQSQRAKTKTTVGKPKQKDHNSVSTKTNTSSTAKKPQQLMRSVQKHAKGKTSQYPTKSIERMLGEYSPKGLTKTSTKQKTVRTTPQTRVGRQPLTKKDEVRQFKEGIASTRNKRSANDIAYMEYEKSLGKRAAIQRRMRNNRER